MKRTGLPSLLFLPAILAGCGAPTEQPGPSKAEPVSPGDQPRPSPARFGFRLTSEQAAALEEELASRPDDPAAHRQLLEYYAIPSLEAGGDSPQRLAFQEHALWLIREAPHYEMRGPHLDPIIDGAAWKEARTLWNEQVRRHGDDPRVLGNAANFFLIQDEERAAELLRQARDADPDDPAWADRIAQLRMLHARSKASDQRRASALEALAELENAPDPANEMMARAAELSRLKALAKAAFLAEEWDKAEGYAEELLARAPDHEGAWDYGNALHHGHNILGRVALERGDVEAAKQHLIESGRTPGSPQLNSFGPNMSLAKGLLEVDETDVVIEYFELCASFWKRDQLDTWTEQVRAGSIPSFGANLVY